MTPLLAGRSVGPAGCGFYHRLKGVTVIQERGLVDSCWICWPRARGNWVYIKKKKTWVRGWEPKNNRWLAAFRCSAEALGLCVTAEHLVPNQVVVICGLAVPLHGKH